MTTSDAYAEVQFDDIRPALNQAMLEQLLGDRVAIEGECGATLEWRGPESGTLLTRRTKITTPKQQIGHRTDPTEEGLQGLTAAARRLIDAVKPRLQIAYDEALARVERSEELNVGP